MELHQLRYMIAVAQAGSFSRAAERCHVSQPSLSQQIQKLEDELNEKLFERLPRQVKLTVAGEVFLLRAERVLAELDSARREIQDQRGSLSGPLRIGALPTIAPYLLPTVISAFSRVHPDVEIVVQEDTTARLLELGCGCEIDLALASLPAKDDRFEIELLFQDELLLALPLGHSLAEKKSIALEDLKNERFILMKEGHCLGDQVLDFCHRRDFHPQVSCRSVQIQTVQALVHAGLGISLVPKMAVPKRQIPGPEYRVMESPAPSRAIVALWLRQRVLSRAAREFLAHLRKLKPGFAKN